MDIQTIKALIDIVADERLAELSVADGSAVVEIRARNVVASPPTTPAMLKADATALEVQDLLPPPAPPAVVPKPRQIIAPMAGTFHRSPSAGGTPFVEVGHRVSDAAPVCVIEAMKMMNEVVADCEGTVRKILCADGEAVVAGQPLFDID